MRIGKKAFQKPVGAYIYIFGVDNYTDIKIETPKIGIEIREIKDNDVDAIDELTEIDEWKIARSVTIENLQSEWCCYVGIYQDKIVASVWVFLGS